jgi:hypothetical protein
MGLLVSLDLFVCLNKVPNNWCPVLKAFDGKKMILATVRRQGESDIEEGFANHITTPITKAFVGNG